jgi:hypothetical protein
VALIWHEIACRCLWWPCDENLWSCMMFVVCMLYVLCLVMLRSYAHDQGFFSWKLLKLWSWLCHMYMSLLSCWRCLYGILGYLACSISLLAPCSDHFLFEKLILAFVDLVHALPTRGRSVHPIQLSSEITKKRVTRYSCVIASRNPGENALKSDERKIL